MVEFLTRSSFTQSHVTKCFKDERGVGWGIILTEESLKPPIKYVKKESFFPMSPEDIVSRLLSTDYLRMVSYSVEQAGPNHHGKGR